MPITFSRHGSYGKFGNQLFQRASLLGFSKKYNTSVILNPWAYSEYFEQPDPFQGNVGPIHLELDEPQFHYIPEHWDQYKDDFRNKMVNITAWLQTEKYFEHCMSDVKKMFTFKKEVTDRVRKPFEDAGLFTKETIAISVRRGDYVGNPSYDLLPIKYYLLALIEEFSDFRENYNIIIFSDDYDYCKLHFAALENVWYADQLSGIEQMALGVQCDNFILANSTFSWWMGFLGEKPSSKVIRPIHHFAGELAKRSSIRDYYPARWKYLDHKIKNIDLKHVTFTIPVKFDTTERLDNCELSVKLLRSNFDTHIIVGEQGHFRFKHMGDIVRYVEFKELKDFHRTKMLNDMAGMASTNIVVNWDCDVMIPPLSIIQAAYKLQMKEADMVYPYDGRFARVPRHKWLRTIQASGDVGFYGNTQFNGMGEHDPASVGGALMVNMEAFVKAGMENEKMISYGPEDAERYDRFNKLGYRVARVPGVLYHMDHICSTDSGASNPYYKHNTLEMEKIRSLTPAELRSYVNSWPWTNRYMPSYYDGILEESVKSRDVVFEVLFHLGILSKGDTIIDAGCGLGSWGFQLTDYNYLGIDFEVPFEKLVIPENTYLDADLRKPIELPVVGPPMELVICAEVAEHLEEQYADQLIDNLCSLGSKILFSAATPGQGGVNHFNEQWQSYWAEKFEKRGYYPFVFDIRKYFWNNENVGVWYRQNMVLYGTAEDVFKKADYPLDVVHPEMFMNLMKHHRII